MAGQLRGKIALVTGGSSGIGRATALAFAREGAKVVVADVDVKGGQETIRLIREAKGEATFVKADVSKEAEVEALVNKTVETYGRLDYAHNNAGIPGSSAFLTELSEEEWDRIINVNLKGVWLCMKYEIAYMAKHSGRAIVNTASVSGLRGDAKMSCYAASKHGVIGLTKSAALEYANVGIRINDVCPGPTRTPLILGDLDPQLAAALAAQTPLGRMGTPEDIAEAVVWLCSDAASFVTGHSMVVDGGLLARFRRLRLDAKR